VIRYRQYGGGRARSEAFSANYVVNPTNRLPAFVVMTPECLLKEFAQFRIYLYVVDFKPLSLEY
jgi:hypothetical protein